MLALSQRPGAGAGLKHCAPARGARLTSVRALEDSPSFARAEAPNNLGQLNRAVITGTGYQDEYSSYRVSAANLSNRGLYVDGPSVFVNGSLLLLLIALSAGRIFSLDKRIAEWMKKQKEERDEERRTEINSARQALESSWDGPENELK